MNRDHQSRNKPNPSTLPNPRRIGHPEDQTRLKGFATRGHPEDQKRLKGCATRDFNVWSLKKRVEKLHYMHMNPLKRKLVDHPKDWPWSSFSFYANPNSD
jgi:hypothetical protein